MAQSENEDRELLLSMYLDGELDAGQALAVEEKLRTDAAWKADYQVLVDSEKRVSKVVQNNWHDAEFTERVMDEVKAHSTKAALAAWNEHSGSRDLDSAGQADRERRRFRWGWPALAASAALLTLALSLRFFSTRTAPSPASTDTPVRVAQFEPSAARRDPEQMPGTSLPAGELLSGQTLSALHAGLGPTPVHWSDGSTIWLGSGAGLKGVSARSFVLTRGPVWIEAAPQAEPFTIELPDASMVEALGTRFALDGGAGGFRVRVVEGHVRRHNQPGRSADARGGQVIEADFGVRSFDPREVALTWLAAPSGTGVTAGSSRLELAAPWPQLGGSPGHTGWTPVAGPAGLAATRFIPFPSNLPVSRETASHYAPAVMGTQGRVYILHRVDGDATQLYRFDLAAGGEEWKSCGDPLPGSTQASPVITPKGLVVAGTTGKIVQAWDVERGTVAWKKNVDSSVYALCAAYDGMILCSTEQGLVALSERGEKRWSYTGVTQLVAPACATPDGMVYAVSLSGEMAVLDREGRPLKRPAVTGSFSWPPVAREDGSVWLVSNQGALSAVGSEPAVQRLLPTEAKISTWPLANGIYSTENALRTLGGGGLQAQLPVQGRISALAADGSGYIYAAIKDKLYRLKAGKESGEIRQEHSAAKQGEVVQGGIAIIPGRVMVTTTEGIQVFE